MSFRSSLGSQIYKAATLAFRKSIYHDWNYPAETTAVSLFIPKSQCVSHMILWNIVRREAISISIQEKMTSLLLCQQSTEGWMQVHMGLQEWQGFKHMKQLMICLRMAYSAADWCYSHVFHSPSQMHYIYIRSGLLSWISPDWSYTDYLKSETYICLTLSFLSFPFRKTNYLSLFAGSYILHN